MQIFKSYNLNIQLEQKKIITVFTTVRRIKFVAYNFIMFSF
jgi:hypothetical protein